VKSLPHAVTSDEKSAPPLRQVSSDVVAVHYGVRQRAGILPGEESFFLGCPSVPLLCVDLTIAGKRPTFACGSVEFDPEGQGRECAAGGGESPAPLDHDGPSRVESVPLRPLVGRPVPTLPAEVVKEGCVHHAACGIQAVPAWIQVVEANQLGLWPFCQQRRCELSFARTGAPVDEYPRRQPALPKERGVRRKKGRVRSRCRVGHR